MKKVIQTILFILSVPLWLTAQPTQVKIYAEYTIPVSDRLEINNADAFGGRVQFDFNISENLLVGLNTGYSLYSITQKNQLFGWGWQFWNDRYYDKIESDLRANPNLAVEIGSIQKMDLIPVVVNFSFIINVINNLKIAAVLGGGIHFYTKRLYATETWSKYFEEEDYTFTYSYRNFAPKKNGNPIIVNGKVDLEYSIFENFNLSGGVNYVSVIATENSMGYDEYPFKSELGIFLGITILY